MKQIGYVVMWSKVLVNLITAIRIPLALIIYREIVSGDYLAALLLFMLAAATDWIDGELARLLKATSRFGATFEHIADGTMMVAVCWGFTRLDILPSWLLIGALIYCIITWFLPLKFENRYLGMAAALRTLIYGVLLAGIPLYLVLNLSDLRLRYTLLSVFVIYGIVVLAVKRKRISHYWRYFLTGKENKPILGGKDDA